MLLDALWRQTEELFSSTTRPKRQPFAEDIAERHEFVAFMRQWWPPLRPLEALRWLADPERLRRYGDGVLSRNEVELLTSSYKRLDVEGPSVEDVALLDELHDVLGDPPARPRARQQPFMVGGVREVTTYADRIAAARASAVERPEDYREYAHVVVDEAQDVSPMQWRMIGRRGLHASWTIVGDPAQSAWVDGVEAMRAMNAALGTRTRHEFLLNTNYRNAAEIFALAAAVIRRTEPGISLPQAVRTAGIEPTVRRVPIEDVREAVREATVEMLEAVEGTVGVIASMARRDEVSTWLSDLTAGGGERLQVVGSLEAKGMEYDAVIVVEPAELRDESAAGVRTLYVALSRATQRLVTVGGDDSWLPDQAPVTRSAAS
jgi:hypothetical protein